MTKAMRTEHSPTNQERKVLVFPARAKTADGRPVFFLFSLFQMEDVLSAAQVREVPFSPSYLAGITDWRGQVVPVISLENLLGLAQDDMPYNERLAVIHSVNQADGGRDDLWGMIRITRTIKMLSLPIPCTPAANPFPGREAFVRGAYEWEQGILVVLNMENILSGNKTMDGHCVQ